MSQEKVNRYKEYKKNKTKILKRQKMVRRAEVLIAAVVACIFVAWFGWSIYRSVSHSSATPAAPVVTEIDANAYSDYISGLQASFSA